MKATGIVRRIDDLGRVVIPKEIRRTLRIREGDPMEIFTNAEGAVVFKKYSPIGELSNYAAQYAEVLYKAGNLPVLVCDRDNVIAVSGVPKKELLERRVSSELEELMSARKNLPNAKREGIRPVEGVDRYAYICAPILSQGGRQRRDYVYHRRWVSRTDRSADKADPDGSGSPRQAD